MRKLLAALLILAFVGTASAGGFKRLWKTKAGWLGMVAESEMRSINLRVTSEELGELGKLSEVDGAEIARLEKIHKNRLARARSAWNHWQRKPEPLGTEASVDAEFSEAEAALDAIATLHEQAIQNPEGMAVAVDQPQP